MTVAQNEIVRVDLIAEAHASEDVFNVFQYRKESAGSAADSTVLTDFLAIMRIVAEIIDALCKATVIWRRIRVQNISTGLLVGEATFSPTIPGVEASDAGAMGVAAVVSFPTNVPRVTMRKYIGPLAEGVLGTAGTIGSNPGTVQLSSLVTALLADQAGPTDTWRFGYLSPKTGVFQLPTAGVINTEPGYQRRRRRGTGS